MEQVLYADVLFFINFSMDFITLYLTSRLTSGPPAGIRSIIAAALGGIYGTAAVAFNAEGMWSVLPAAAVSLGMVALSMGWVESRLFFRRAAVFWGLGALLGGVMTALCSLGGTSPIEKSVNSTTILLFLGSSLCLGLTRLISRFGKRHTVRIRVTLRGRSTEFTALCDSGNLLADPLSARPAVIADRSVLRSIIPDACGETEKLPDELRIRLRMIPAKGLGGGTVLTGFIPDSTAIFEGGKERPVDAVIAVADLGRTFFGGYPANAPSSIL